MSVSPRRRRTSAPRSLAVGVVLVALLVGASGCYSFRAHVPGVVRSDVDDRVEVVGSFDISFRRDYYLWGLVGPGEAEFLEDALMEEVRRAGGDGVANLVVESRFEGWDVVSRVLTFGVHSPRSYRVHGDIVRIAAPPVPGRPLLEHGPAGASP